MFDALLGNARVKDALRRMLQAGRVPGALIFAGLDGVGKRAFALELARALNCMQPHGVEGCGHCNVCRRIVTFPPPSGDDKDAEKKIQWSDFIDVGMARPAGRFIRVGTMRQLEHEANFRPNEGKARVLLVDAADRMNDEAANALLKTLEEPPPTSHIVLLTSRLMMLLPTIRSRCQIIRFAPLATAEIEKYLLHNVKLMTDDARLRAQLAQGSLGIALELNLEEYRTQRGAMLETLHALTDAPNRVRLLRVSEELNDAKRKEYYESYLTVLATLMRDAWQLALGRTTATLVNQDVLSDIERIARRAPSANYARWIQSIEKHLGELTVNVNRKVALDALLLGME